MSEVGDELRREKARYQDVAFKVFAVVGFLSSIVTIASWLSSTQASLTTVVNPTTIEIPRELQVANIQDARYDLESAIKDLTDKYCNPVEVNYSGEQSKNFFYSAEKCERSKSFFSAVSKTAELAGKKLVAWDVHVTNDGKEIAENITLRTPVPVGVRAADAEGNPISIEATPSNRVFSIPNLNPGDTIDLRLVSTTPVPERYEADLGRPRITFSGGVASNREYIRISGRYSGIVAFLDDLPTVLQILIIFIAALFLTLIWMLPLALLSDANDKRKARRSSAESNQPSES